MSTDRPARSTGSERETDAEPTTGFDDRAPLLDVDGLKKHFPVNTGFIDSIRFDTDRGGVPFYFDDTSVKAVDGVSFSLEPGETFGVVGESGCGKSTLARTILGLEEPTAGRIRFDGRPVEEIPDAEFHERSQMVFQDPQSSLNSRRKVGHIIEDPLEGSGWEKDRRRERALELLEAVGLKREYYNRYPHEFSGGQRQRINLARALSINPDLVVADEPVSGLDVSVQAKILNLMDRLQDEFGLTYLLISHNLSVVRYIADRVAVMYVGDFVEVADADQLFAEQYHPYAKALLGAVPNPDPDKPGVRSDIEGQVPSASDPPRGCKFHTRCPEFILPDGFDSRAVYDGYVTLLEDLRNGRIEGDASDPGTIVDGYLPGRDGLDSAIGREIERGVEQALDDEWERAIETVSTYESVCQRTVPDLEPIDGERRRAACHLWGDSGSAERDGLAFPAENSTDDGGESR